MARWVPWRKKETERRAAEVTTAPDSFALEAVPLSRERENAPSVEGQPSSDVTKRSVWRRGLSRLRRTFSTPLERLFRGRPFSEEMFAELEETLLSADVGGQTTAFLLKRLQERCRRERPQEGEVLKVYLKEEMLALLQKLANPPLIGAAKPWVILVVGVNGVGKTTTIAKLAARFRRQQKTVMLVAADTFRAAAIEQLEVWAGRLGVDLVKHRSGASPAAVAFDGIKAAIARDIDVVIIDTAGRLHTKTPLMEELKKVYRVIARELPEAPHETLLVLDAATGQNALSQAQSFQQAFALTGVILTKLDGSAKGGVVLAVVERFGVPIRCVGLGEREEDLQDFDAEDFVEALFTPVESPETALYLDREMSEP